MFFFYLLLDIRYLMPVSRCARRLTVQECLYFE
jgi:hypothetical protein